MKTYGVVGKSLSHSFSPAFFNAYFSQHNIQAGYKILEIETIDQITPYFKGAFDGLNVTIPYKEAVIPFLDFLSAEAQAIGAVNTVVFNGGKTIGHNTDAHGFQQTIKPFLTFEHERALILALVS